MLEIRKNVIEHKWNFVADKDSDKDYLVFPVITYKGIKSEERLQVSMIPMPMPN